LIIQRKKNKEDLFFNDRNIPVSTKTVYEKINKMKKKNIEAVVSGITSVIREKIFPINISSKSKHEKSED
jgi:hypothetical protein